MFRRADGAFEDRKLSVSRRHPYALREETFVVLAGT